MTSIDDISTYLSQRKSFVVATVVHVVGSSPRKPGSRLLLFESGASEGSIGGGALEKQVLEDAAKFLRERRTETKLYDLTRELGMCCGGRVEIFFEVFRPADRLYLFGAGHVAKPLAEIATLAHFEVTIMDER